MEQVIKSQPVIKSQQQLFKTKWHSHRIIKTVTMKIWWYCSSLYFIYTLKSLKRNTVTENNSTNIVKMQNVTGIIPNF